ncbi:zinc finger protein 771-like [Myripristis murdjan]|uniref:Zinc finger protein 771-like n=1 Tax=Myripristis murdjan TaxID=586833 RepID=A0A668ATQ0_9TELE|nr:zinc finger protein 771-like [Myripristis murdjan]
MFKTEKLKALVNERLKAAAEEIFDLFERTIKDYEEEVSRSKQETDRPRRLQDGWKAPPQLSAEENEALCVQQHCEEGRTSLGQEDQELPQIKEEQEELWTNEETVQLQGVEEADTKDSMFNIIYVQRGDEDGRHPPHQSHIVENKGEPLPSSSTEKMKAEPDEEGCTASEPASDCQSFSSPQSVAESEDGDSDDNWRDSGDAKSGTNTKKPQQLGETIERPYKCSVCNKNFRIKSILTRHMKTHTGEKPYSCSVCGKSFIQRSYLQTHMNSHSGQKPYTCTFCGRGFTQVGNMNAHIRIHTGEKPHSCTDCGKCFREKADLIKHTIIHTGEKPYSCTICNMKFSAQSNLTRHIKTHSGERPYCCVVCGKRFIRRSHLNIHMKTHVGENL